MHSPWVCLKPICSPRRRSPPLAVTSCVGQPSLAVDLFSLEICYGAHGDLPIDVVDVCLLMCPRYFGYVYNRCVHIPQGCRQSMSTPRRRLLLLAVARFGFPLSYFVWILLRSGLVFGAIFGPKPCLTEAKSIYREFVAKHLFYMAIFSFCQICDGDTGFIAVSDTCSVCIGHIS